MATSSTRRPGPRRLRRLAGLVGLLGAGLLLLAAPSAPIVASAAVLAPPRIPSPTPTPCTIFVDNCPVDSPSPVIVVISPVPLDPAPPPSTPSYLIGTLPPSPAPSTADAGGSPVPLGGGFNDLPSPNPGAISSSTNAGNGGLPLPLLLAGLVVLVGAAGAVLYAVAPLGERFPEKIADSPTGGLNPYRAESSELNLIDPQAGQSPRARRPRSGL